LWINLLHSWTRLPSNLTSAGQHPRRAAIIRAAVIRNYMELGR
jgi:hypothetical protein